MVAGDYAYSPYLGISAGDVYYFGVGGYSSSSGNYYIQMICNTVAFQTTDWNVIDSTFPTEEPCEDSGDAVCCYGYPFDSACAAVEAGWCSVDEVTLLSEMACDDDTSACPAGTDLADTEIGRNQCCEFDYSECCVKTCDDGSSLQGDYVAFVETCGYEHICGYCSGVASTFECPASSGSGSVTLDINDNCEFSYEQCCAEEDGCTVSGAEYDSDANTVYCDYECVETTTTTSIIEETEAVCVGEWTFLSLDDLVQDTCEFCSCSTGTRGLCQAIARVDQFEDVLREIFTTACNADSYPALQNENGEQCDLAFVGVKSGATTCDCNALQCNNPVNGAKRHGMAMWMLLVAGICAWM